MRIVKETPANDLETLYRLMMRRIAKGYTAEQLNYLIAAPYHYVEDIESLKKAILFGWRTGQDYQRPGRR